MKFRAAIFDFDETMIDLERQHAAATEALCRDFGDDYESLPEAIRLASGRRIVDELAQIREAFCWREPIEELLERRQRYFDEVCRTSDLALMPGVEQAVRALHARGLTLAITSSAVGPAIDAILRRFGLRAFFALIVDGSAVTHGKPDPEAFLITSSRLGVEPRDCVVFEDSHVGVVAAKRAGMTCIAIRNPHAYEEQDLSAADLVLGSFLELDVDGLRARPA